MARADLWRGPPRFGSCRPGPPRPLRAIGKISGSLVPDGGPSLKRICARDHNIVILTGAASPPNPESRRSAGRTGYGKGTESRIVATPEAFARDADLVQAFYDARRARLGRLIRTRRTRRLRGSTPNGQASS